MASDTETARKLGVGSEFAALQLEDLATAVAAEVMMMGLAGNLIPQSLTGHGDRREPVAFEQRTDVAIYGGDAETFDLSLRCGQHLFR